MNEKIRDQFMINFGKLEAIKEFLGRKPAFRDEEIPYDFIDSICEGYKIILIQVFGKNFGFEEPEE